ncbi:TIGR00282 family metallophosphoesterase [Alkalispirochaeta alkalica]|uniref:TIGR00282 family metallophosphoesterase n=1 Tax=Alkalispirochaeta alkalica TaxID=46356 RepID=UPI00037748C4|nr:TIGR00282 family metallophosphoesterase [Alkalispirochaeta alkalica]
MRILILGDIIGQPGMRAVVSALKGLTRRFRADFVVVNGENAADGFGINRELADQLFRAGAQVITTGNHVWHDPGVTDLLEHCPEVLRPDNYPKGAPGSGVCVSEGRQGRVAVVNLQGRDRMPAIDCPFRRFREIRKTLGNNLDAIIVDFHAETTSEKEAFGRFVDGEVSVIYGTHTHIQTADERILPGGTAYITDAGACLAEQSVIGFNPAISTRRALTQLPLRNEVAQGTAIIHGLCVETEKGGLKALSVERVQFRSLV